MLGVATFLSSTQNQYVVALASFSPYLVLLTVVGLIVALIGRRWILVGVAVVVCAVGGWMFGPIYIGDVRADAAESPTGSVRVMQANLMLGLADPAGVVDSVNDRDIDVLTVQELTYDAETALADAGVLDSLPHLYTAPTRTGGGGVGIYSRYPLSNQRELPGFTLGNLAADIDTGSRTVTVYSVHPVPPYPTPASLWASEMGLLRSELTGLPEDRSVIVSGDFNSTHSHSQFRELLDAGYRDAAEETGSGLLPTYPTDKGIPAVVGIDHILTRNAAATALERISVPGSDHHGLISKIVPFPR